MGHVILGRSESGEYVDAALNPVATAHVRRYTAYVVYPFDPAALALDLDGLAAVVAAGDASVEEIDVDAATGRHAREIAEKALARDYELGGRRRRRADRLVHVGNRDLPRAAPAARLES
jgi:hypothetical protein